MKKGLFLVIYKLWNITLQILIILSSYDRWLHHCTVERQPKYGSKNENKIKSIS